MKIPDNLVCSMVYVYAIRDVLQDYGNSLYTFPNDEVAKRWFLQVVSSSVMPKDRGDLELWKVGGFDKESGMLILSTSDEYCKNERLMLGSEVE